MHVSQLLQTSQNIIIGYLKGYLVFRVERGGAVVGMSDSQSTEPGFELS